MKMIKPSSLPKIWNRLDKYIFGEVHSPFLMAMLIYNGIFFINTFTKITGLAGDIELPFHLFMFLFLSYVPEILHLTLPISFLFASQAALTRMSSDSEIIAPLSTGVSFWRMNRAILVYGLFLSVFSFILVNWLEPSMAKLADQKYRTFVKSSAIPNLSPGVITTMGKKDVLYVDRIVDQTLIDLIHISHSDEEEKITFAKEAEFVNDGEGNWSLELSAASIMSFSDNPDQPIQMTSGRRLRREFPHSGAKKTSLFGNPKKRLNSLELYQNTIGKGEYYSEQAVEFLKRIWLSFTCLIFSIFAAPLAVKHSRLGGRSSFGISLLLITAFMFLFKTGTELAASKSVHPLIAMSATPIMFLVLGIFLQIGKHRGWGHKTQKFKDSWLTVIQKLKIQIFRVPTRLAKRRSDQKKGRRAAYTARFPTKIDVYVTKFFFKTWALIQMSVISLILLIEYTQIAPFAKKNHIDGSAVLEYLAFSIPKLADTTIFFCLLIAVLVVFAIMSNHQEITAIRAGGGSLQRLCLPLIIIGILASINSYYMENLLIPWSDRNASTVKNMIKHKEPALFTRDVWMKTRPNQLLNFKYFNKENKTIHESIFYSLDPDSHVLKMRSEYPEIVYSSQHGWINQQDSPRWEFQEGESKDAIIQSTVPKGEILDIGIELKDMEQKKRKPSEFSISELKDYYQYLHDMGFKSDHFFTEMLAKMAQPFLPLIMMLLAMPMGFQYGRRGSIYGIGVGIMTGLSFWALFELFKRMGASGVLPPPIAAWGIIGVFSVAALWRFIRMGD